MRQENAKNWTVDRWPLTKRSTGSSTGRPIRRGWESKEAPTRYFSHCSLSLLENPSHTCFQISFWVGFWTDWRLWSWFWDVLRLGFWFETQGFSFWGWFLSDRMPQAWIQPHLRAPRASGWCLLFLVWFHSPFRLLLLLIPFVGWLPGERRASPGLRASALLSHLSLSRRRLAKRRGMTRPSSVPSKTISDTRKNSPRGKSS